MQVNEAFRVLALVHHPDKGGCRERFNRIPAARDVLNEHIGRSEALPFNSYHCEVGCTDCVALCISMGDCDCCCRVQGNRGGHTCGLFTGVRFHAPSYEDDLKAFVFQTMAHDPVQDNLSAKRALQAFHELRSIEDARKKERAKIEKEMVQNLHNARRRQLAVATEEKVKRARLEERAAAATTASPAALPLGDFPVGFTECLRCGKVVRVIKKWGSFFYGC